MAINSNPELSPKKNKRIPKHRAEISPQLRKAITEAAHQIRNAHQAELADDLKANRAGELFTNLLRRNEPASPTGEISSPSSARVDLLADEVGGFVSDAIRGGTGLLEGSLKLTEEWLAMLSAPNDERLPAADATHEHLLPSTASEVPSIEASVPRDYPSAVPPPNPDEVRIQAFLRQFMPMLASAVRQGRNGYGLAETVVRLFGRRTYDEASGLGDERIMQLIQGEPALWAQVAPIEGAFRKFLNEFTHYETWSAEQSETKQS
jgi:hypothetical protein